ncbi:MAG: RagB/SusD family nutrient uptake outer membrane protein [Bacteroidales bacterium]|nr:RagB/SusD family nutrient uptake outer membrane protein [Bacteroidales bacterium]
MKNILKISLAALSAAFLLASCSLLEENPTTSLSETVVYNTPEALETQLNGCYLAAHNNALWKGTMAEYLHTASGMMIWKGARNTDEWLDGLNFAKYSTSSYGNYRIWDAIWIGVNYFNRLLDNLPSSPVEESFKKEIEGEVKFLRGLFYFTAVRLWGDVPLILSSPTSVGDVNNPRVAWYKVYAQVIKDLEFAEKNMRSDYAAIQAEEKSRPCNWAATALKASVYLTIASLLEHPDDNFWDSSKDAELIAAGLDPRTPDFTPLGIRSAADAYELAFDTAVDVIEKGPYSLCDYKQLFRWTEHEDWFLPEAIFVLPSSNTAGTNYNSVRMLPEYPEGTANKATKNSNYGRVRPSRFAIENVIKTTGGTLGTGTDNYEIYAKTLDPRFDVTYITSYKRADNGNSVTTYPISGRVETSSATYQNPYYGKYLDPSYNVSAGKADFYVIRLAEMYLIAAEAAAALGKTDTAIEYLNVIRARARGIVKPGDAPTSAFPEDFKKEDFASTDELQKAIFWERQCELAAEGHEYFDTHRHGATWLRDMIAVPHNAFMKMPCHALTFEYTYKNRLMPEDVNDLRKSLLVALPEKEIRLNTAVNGQNDFYWQ